jgi:hypothetical protein
MADNAVPFELAEACLTHTVGNAVVQAYQRSSMLEHRRPIMAAWAPFLSGEGLERGADEAGGGVIAMKKVTRDQLEISENKLSRTLKVIHTPTGAWLDGAGHENMERAGRRLENGDDYSPNEVRAMALELLREHKKIVPHDSHHDQRRGVRGDCPDARARQRGLRVRAQRGRRAPDLAGGRDGGSARGDAGAPPRAIRT